MSLAIIIHSEDDATIMAHIKSCGDIPMSTNRNRDYTPILGEFDMVVGFELDAIHRTVGNTIKVYTNGTTYPVFIGEITETEINYDTASYTLTIRDKLYLLNEKAVTPANLESLIQAGTGIEYWASEELVPYSSVQVLFLIETMFADCGLAFEFQTLNYEITGMDTVSGHTIDYRHLRIDEKMLWHINQPYVNINFNDAKNYGNNITYWDFISFYLSTFGHRLELKQTAPANTYEINWVTQGAFIQDGNTFGYQDKTIKNDNQGWRAVHRFSDNRYHYRGWDVFPTTPLPVDSEPTREESFSGGIGLRNLRVYDNLVILYHKWWETGNQTIWGSTDDNGAYLAGECVSAQKMTERQEKAKNSDWNIKTRSRELDFRSDAFRVEDVDVQKHELKTIYETEV